MAKEPQNSHQPDIDDVQDDAVIGTALKWSLALFGAIGVVVAGIVIALNRPDEAPELVESELAQTQVRKVDAVQIPRAPFVDITESAGINFQHVNGATGQKFLPETMGGGCAFLDFDNDGDQDLLLVNSQTWPWDQADQEDNNSAATSTLYRNDGAGQFTDVTARSGVDFSCYGMGVAVGDYDKDGWLDLFISAVGRNYLLHNQQDGTFADVTNQAGVAGDANEWSSSCGWFDYDRDGDLDLMVCNYVKWSKEFDESQNFQLVGGGRAYGRPQNFGGTFPYLYRNEGDGTFVEVAEAAGLHKRNPATDVPMAKSLGVTFADFDQDGWIDMIVANDTVQNFLFHNQKDGSFQEVGVVAGVAFDMNGHARGAMGIDAARFRDNGAIGIAIGNFANEMTALYVSNPAQMQFMDEAISSGLGPNTRLELTFGVFYFDYDLDGRLDLFAANGHLEEDINRVQSSQHYEQPPQLFWNCGSQANTEFMPVKSEACGTDLLKPMVGRGAAYADIDSDGDLDLLVTGIGQSPRLLRNDQQLGHHWLRFHLIGSNGNINAIGAWIEVDVDGKTLRRQVMPSRSYLSQMELPVTIGLGMSTSVSEVRILWPDGSRQTVDIDTLDKTYEVKQAAVEQAE